ncbi:MAG: chemotaxis protein CheX [Deltaproteobacteria bacterium]|nr:chemotaxis protein CheX [Deltaproteobacteria bacterium]
MQKLTADQTDGLTELINIGVGRAAGVLNDMTESHVSLRVPAITLLSQDTIDEELGDMSDDLLASVQLRFAGSFSGTAALVFPTESANKLVTALTGDDEDDQDLDEIRVGTLNEVGNIVVNGVMGSISNVLSEAIEYTVPDYKEDVIANLLRADTAGAQMTVLLAATHFTIEELRLGGEIILLFEVGSFDALVAALDQLMEE